MKSMSLDSVLEFGAHKGTKVEHVLKANPSYFPWLRNEKIITGQFTSVDWSDELNIACNSIIDSARPGSKMAGFKKHTDKAVGTSTEAEENAFAAIKAALHSGGVIPPAKSVTTEVAKPAIKKAEKYDDWGDF
jgi:hypothetical protein